MVWFRFPCCEACGLQLPIRFAFDWLLIALWGGWLFLTCCLCVFGCWALDCAVCSYVLVFVTLGLVGFVFCLVCWWVCYVVLGDYEHCLGGTDSVGLACCLGCDCLPCGVVCQISVTWIALLFCRFECNCVGLIVMDCLLWVCFVWFVGNLVICFLLADFAIVLLFLFVLQAVYLGFCWTCWIGWGF